MKDKIKKIVYFKKYIFVKFITDWRIEEKHEICNTTSKLCRSKSKW